MKKLLVSSILGLALVAALGFGFIPSMEQSASCADCNSDDKTVAMKIYEKFTEECTKLIPDATTPAKQKACYVVNTYNKLLPKLKALAKDNRFGPGDRILFVGESQNGNLLAGANRTFQAGAPSPKNTMKVTVNKTDGANGALVKICSIGADGKITPHGNIKFDENNNTGAKSLDVSGLEGRIVRIEVASFGKAVAKFKYTLNTAQ
jgi:hypothetical protein